MKKILVIIFVFCLIFLTACHQKNKTEFVFQDSQGQNIRFSTLKGKWIFIHYWATWCHTCLEELPVLNQFYANTKNTNIIIFGVNYDDLPNSQLMTDIKKLQIQFPVLLGNPNTVLKLTDVTAVPTTFVINPTGKLVKTLLGPQTLASLNHAMKNN
ncbi:MAG: thiol-disulfide oxidoreductase [uncultured bacterium]|nr:MAG: thiol-disulfide oxidoreductase [uncultured bacterium]